MLDRTQISQQAKAAFDEIWGNGDPWDLESSDAIRTSYDHQLALLSTRPIGRAVEIGCAAGAFTRHLATIADSILAIDVAEPAIERARTLGLDPERVEFRVLSAIDLEPEQEGPFDAVVLSETLCCVGWLYPMFDLGWLVWALLQATNPGGRLLMANTYGKEHDYLLLPWLIDTYRDLVRNVGWKPERHDVLEVVKDGVPFTVAVDLFERA